MSFNFSKVVVPPTAVGVIFQDTTNTGATATIKAPSVYSSSYTLTLPPNPGTLGDVLTTDGVGTLDWTAGSSTGVPTPTSIVHPKIEVNNVADSTIGHLVWDNSTYSGSVTSITAIIWYSNMATSGRNLIVTIEDGLNTSSTTIVAPTSDGVATLAVTKPSSDVTWDIKVRRSTGSSPNPIIKGITFQFL